MRAILLAAGRGRRLGQDLPKVLLSIEGKTLFERHVVNLVESGISALTIVVGYRKETMDRTQKPVALIVPGGVLE